MAAHRVAELFAEINRCEPVLHVDLPEGGAADTKSGGGEELAAALAGAAEALRRRFPDMFKESQVRIFMESPVHVSDETGWPRRVHILKEPSVLFKKSALDLVT